jgi:hypothetical protein
MCDHFAKNDERLDRQEAKMERHEVRMEEALHKLNSKIDNMCSMFKSEMKQRQ